MKMVSLILANGKNIAKFSEINPLLNYRLVLVVVEGNQDEDHGIVAGASC